MDNELFNIEGVQAPKIGALSELAGAGEHFLRGRDDSALDVIRGVSTMDFAGTGWTGVIINAVENPDDDLELSNIEALWVTYAATPSDPSAKYALALLRAELTPWAEKLEATLEEVHWNRLLDDGRAQAAEEAPFTAAAIAEEDAHEQWSKEGLPSTSDQQAEAEVAEGIQKFADVVFGGDLAAAVELQRIAVLRQALSIKDSSGGLSAQEEAYGDVLYEAAEELVGSRGLPGAKVNFNWDPRGGCVSVHAEGIVGDRPDGGLAVPISSSKLKAALSASDLCEADDTLSIGSKATP
ncbi:hypothetical protein ACW0US_17700 [Xanthomonas euvesicatoria]